MKSAFNSSLLTLLGFFFFSFSVLGQDYSIRGKLIDKESGEPVISASVQMINVKDTTNYEFATSGLDGDFYVKGLEQAFYRLKVTNVAYQDYTRLLRISGAVDIGKISLTPDIKMLELVEVKGDVVPVEVKGDTVLYNAEAYRVNPDATAADLVSKMPGITVSDDGVSSNGESVEQVLLDGKRFFGQDPLLALNTIPAEVVNKVELFDQKSEAAQFTGFDDGNTTKTINVVTKEDKRNGQFGKLTAGIGSDDRNKVELNISQRSKDKDITLLAMTNNVNQRSFTSSDIMGVGGAGGGRPGQPPGSTSGQTQASGIALTQSIGTNFSDEWGTKGRIEGSYFYDKSGTDTEDETERETFLTEGSQLYTETSSNHSDNENHRVNMRMEYNLNDNNSILFMPRLTFQDNASIESTTGLAEQQGVSTQTDNLYNNTNKGYSLNGDLMLRHKFEKTGRTLMWNVGTEHSDADKESTFDDLIADSTLLYESSDKSAVWSSDWTFSEPVGYNSQIQFGYQISQQERDAYKDTYSVEGDTENRFLEEELSSSLTSEVYRHTPSISFLTRGSQKFMHVTLAYQNTEMHNHQTIPQDIKTSRNYHALLPSIFSRYQLGGGTELHFMARTETSLPNASQLQTILDNSNPLFYSIGNSNLDQSYGARVMSRLSHSNIEKNRSFNNFLMVRGTNSYITNATFISQEDSVLTDGIVLPAGTQLSQPVNLDGYWNISDNAVWSFLVSPLKTNVNLGVGTSYTRLPGIINNQESIANTYSMNSRIGFNSNISEKVDFNVNYNFKLNKVHNTIQSGQNGQYSLHTVTGKFNFIFWKGLVLRSDINYQYYDAIQDDFNTEYILWNMSLAKKFLKNDKAEIALTVFDLLNQNKGVSQTIAASYIEETRSLVLNQYFMISATYNIRRFKT
jgi:hypothetical protein